MSIDKNRLIVVGDGDKEHWGPVLAALADSYDLTLVSSGYPTWQAAYVEKHRIAEVSNYGSVFGAVGDLRGEVTDAGVFPIDVHTVVPLARSAHNLRMRYVSPEAAVLTADPTALRAALTEGGVPAADGTGESGDLQLTVYSVVQDSKVSVVHATRRQGNSAKPVDAQLVDDWPNQDWMGAAASVVADAHRVAGVDWGVTSTDLRITSDGPVVVALVPVISEQLLTVGGSVGPDLARVAADIAFEREPDPAVLGRLTHH